ncbi:MAG TPA: alpha/beta fold hydrolase [Jatrophihabitans sp.]|nr:alpha/beta fold hydrolase [Jatrophihabitans sp.]
MDIDDTGNPWFTAGTNPAGAMRLFLFPYAGGNPSAFLPWQALLGPRLELRVAVLPGRGVRLFDPPMADMDELVARLTRAVAGLADRPFVFFGHSLGALVAFEVARQLRRAGRPGPVSLWVSGAEGPRTRMLQRRLHDLEEAELIEALHEYNGTSREMLDDQELMQLVLPGVRADFALSERYRYRSEPPLNVPIHVLLGESDPFVEAERAAGWSQESSRPIQVHRYPGDHFFLNDHRQAIATLLADSTARDVAGPAGGDHPATGSRQP